MYLIEVSPIKHLGTIRNLTYFSKYNFSIGDLIKINIRNSETYAIVTGIKSLKEVKADVKNRDYMPKKIRKQEPPHIFNDNFKKAIMQTAKLYAVPEGLVLAQLAPSAILKNPVTLHNKLQICNTKEMLDTKHTKFNITAVNKDLPDRIEHYKASIREKLARGQNVILVVPNTDKARRICSTLKSGIEKMIECYDPHTSQNKLFTEIAYLKEKDTPFCLVGTAQILSLPLQNIGLYILEEQNSIGYARMSFPFVNIKKFAEILAQVSDTELLIGDTFLDLDIYKRALQDQVNIIDGIPRKIRTNKEITLVNIKEEINQAKEAKSDYPFVGKVFLEKIQKSAKKSNKIFVFVPRKGLASQITCKDCGQTVKCVKCALNMKLHSEKNQDNYLLCHRCGHMQDANITCPNCNSWHLIQLGITSEVVANYIQKKTGLKCELINSKTDKGIFDRIANDNLDKQILVGTSVGLNILQPRQIDDVFAIGLDGLMAVPDFQIEEKIFNTLMRLLEISNKSLNIQIKDDSVQAINMFSKRSVNEFIRQELKLREQLAWPPYVVLIKITAKGTKKQIIKDMQVLVNELRDYKIRIFRAFTGAKGKRELSALIKVPYRDWPDNNLIELLKFLPKNMEYRVFPEEVL